MTLLPILPLIPYVALLLAQSEQFQEREVLDPDTDEWVIAPPREGAPTDDELGQARSLLARNEPRKARKLLESWCKGARGG